MHLLLQGAAGRGARPAIWKGERSLNTVHENEHDDDDDDADEDDYHSYEDDDAATSHDDDHD
eukprot:2509631-Pyramimonas_sp.AAC.1